MSTRLLTSAQPPTEERHERWTNCRSSGFTAMACCWISARRNGREKRYRLPTSWKNWSATDTDSRTKTSCSFEREPLRTLLNLTLSLIFRSACHYMPYSHSSPCTSSATLPSSHLAL